MLLRKGSYFLGLEFRIRDFLDHKVFFCFSMGINYRLKFTDLRCSTSRNESLWVTLLRFYRRIQNLFDTLTESSKNTLTSEQIFPQNPSSLRGTDSGAFIRNTRHKQFQTTYILLLSSSLSLLRKWRKIYLYRLQLVLIDF